MDGATSQADLQAFRSSPAPKSSGTTMVIEKQGSVWWLDFELQAC